MSVLRESNIKKLRGRANAALTRLLNGFNTQLILIELKARVEKLEQTYKECDEYDAALLEQDSEIAEFETKVIYQSAIEAFNGVVRMLIPSQLDGL
ncbi:hypothetical protein HNY73_013095 [Argiope bruennichi]|uniref:Uncharacterized protein n=1 Tax=Argiope bruennichi TaxID=94029 RepID=A0A8T0EXM8_ARGBR|nr:hypothetical protein HNY73_013095 [Argiope bruennichi]